MKRTLVERVANHMWRTAGGCTWMQWTSEARRIIAMVRRHDKRHDKEA